MGGLIDVGLEPNATSPQFFEPVTEPPANTTSALR